MVGLRRATPSLLACTVVAACGLGGPAPTAVPVQSPGPAITTSPIPSATLAPPSTAPDTLPPGVARLHDGRLDPGTYRFDGFQPAIEFEVAAEGWEVGHFHDEFFDLFVDGDFPAVGFGRFTDVSLPDGSAVAATSASAVIEALGRNADATVEHETDAELGGLTGRAVELLITAEQTPLFSSAGGIYHLDPGFLTRLLVLDVPGGETMQVLVIGRGDDLDAALEAAEPILDSLVVVG